MQSNALEQIEDPRLLALYLRGVLKTEGEVWLPEKPKYLTAAQIVANIEPGTHLIVGGKLGQALKAIRQTSRYLKEMSHGVPPNKVLQSLKRLSQAMKALPDEERRAIAEVLAATSILVRRAAQTNSVKPLLTFRHLLRRLVQKLATVKSFIVMLKEHGPKKAEAGLWRRSSVAQALKEAREAVRDLTQSTNKTVRLVGGAILKFITDLFYILIGVGALTLVHLIKQEFEPIFNAVKRLITQEEKGEAEEAVAAVMVTAILKKIYREKTGRKEWALVSRKNPEKVLKWFGPKKPSKEEVLKEERRVQFFKHAKK